MLTHRFAIVLTVADETFEKVGDCLSRVCLCYPDTPVVIISDGDTSYQFSKLRVNHLVQLAPGAPLKMGLHNGALWWHRVFAHGLAQDAEYLIKLDADTRVHRRIALLPAGYNGSGVVVAGSLQSRGLEDQHVQGGFQVFTRQFAYYAMREAQDERYRNPDTWDMGQAALFWRNNEVSTDYMLAAITSRISGEMIEHPEVDCRPIPMPEPFDAFAAATHPHK